VFTVTGDKFNSEIFIKFLKLILSSTRGPISLVIDNHPVHHSQKVKKFLDGKPRIQLICLPKYSPDLNPQENFWNYLRKKFLNNKLFKNVGEMAFELKEFIKTIPKKVVKSICSYAYLLRRKS
jgi:transposase